VGHDDELLRRIREQQDVREVLAWPFEFDLSRDEPGDGARISSGQPIIAIAGDFAGGIFYLCGDPAARRPVLYADSEGGASLVAADLTEVIELAIGLPYWRDCLKYSGGGEPRSMLQAAGYLEAAIRGAEPSIDDRRTWVSTQLSVALREPEELINRLYDAVRNTSPNFDYADESGEYESLFGEFTPDRNPEWR
jgi:hypothetical protein